MARSNVWSGYISFGLINIPIAVQTAEQSHDLSFNMLDKRNLARIKYNKVNAKTGKEVAYSDIAKGYEYEKDKYVIMSDADFKKANPKASQTLEVHQFVPYDEIDPMLFEKPYYLIPGKGGNKSYFLFQRVLEKSEKVALATVVMHGKEHLTCIIACDGHLVMEMLRFAHEIKHPPEIKDLDHESKKLKFKPQELEMATQLVEQMSGKWDVKEYKDNYYLDLKKYIDKKIKSGQGKVIEEDVGDAAALRPFAVKDTDLMALLKKSLSDKSHHGHTQALPAPVKAHKRKSASAGKGHHAHH